MDQCSRRNGRRQSAAILVHLWRVVVTEWALQIRLRTDGNLGFVFRRFRVALRITRSSHADLSGRPWELRAVRDRHAGHSLRRSLRDARSRRDAA